MAARKRTCLLTLRGVFMRDLVSASVEVVPAEPSIAYTEMPKRFTGVSDWIKSSNLLCNWCALTHANTPMFIPLNLTAEGHADVCGHYCMTGCASAHTRKLFPRDQIPDILAAISRVEAMFTGRRRYIVPANPPPTEMRQYCGNTGLTIPQWREKCARLQADYGA